ncbi:MAG TPA: XdhC/CoxI family protein [Roseiflexaceae bacterium]|nr:XdhC/CoxI family protein [Roseiflexaceae bacterium]
MTTIYAALKEALEAEKPVVVATLVQAAEGVGDKLLVRADGTTLGELGAGLDQQAIVRDALAMLARAESGIMSYSTDAGDVGVFYESYPPPPTMYIVGAVHIAIPLVTYAKTMGFRVVVVDARGAFATPERFDHADELIMEWPDEALEGKLNSNSFVVLLTHDPKLDDPALKIALPSPARYVGALGSPKTHAKRLDRLREDGVPEAQLARLHAPIGLKIGANTPEEIAVSIIAEVVAARHGLTGKS